MVERPATASTVSPVKSLRSVRGGLLCFASCAGLLAPTAVMAERWAFEASVQSQVTATSNSGFEKNDVAKSDVLVEVTPTVAFRGEGARLKLSADLSLQGLAYVKGTQDNEVNPLASLLASLVAVEQFFFIDASANVDRTIINPFGPRPDGASSVNTTTTSTVRLTPYIDWNITPRLHATARSENSATRTIDTVLTDSQEHFTDYAGRHTASLSLLPQPMGLALTYERDDTQYERSSQQRSTTEIARAIASYALNYQFVVGLRAGYERASYPGLQVDNKFYGADINWRPSERTNLSAFAEDRFFGTGWSAAFSHRMPRAAINFQSSRDVATYPENFLTVPAGGSVAGLLDQALTTRLPDPIDRARAVQDLIASRGLPPTLITPARFYSRQTSIETSNSLTAVLLGARNSLGLTAFYLRTESLATLEDSPIVPTSLVGNNVERGASLTFSHQLTPLTAFNATAAWSKTQGLGTSTTEQTDDRRLRLQINHSLGPKTTGFIGARHQVIDSNVTNDSRETAIFAGLGHRF